MQDHEQDNQMADRKRRLTGPTSPGRRNGPAQSSSASSSGAAADTTATLNAAPPGSSYGTAIDLTEDNERPLPPAPPAPPPPLRHDNRATVPSTGRRQSEIVLPKWQPDSDVTQCPVCNTQFTFWYRKHHCRKCGRVVCASCSPHRITIPRQFIVRPPDPPSTILDMTGDTSPTALSTPMQLWGGEEVRVCNPCVPDPNFSPPPQQQPQRSPDPIPSENWSFPSESSAPSLRHPPRRMRNSSGPLPPLPPLPPHVGHRPTLSDASSVSTDYNRRLPQGPFLTHRGAFSSHTAARDLYPASLSSNTYYPPRVSSAGATGGAGTPHLPTPSRPYHNRPLIDIDTSPDPPPQPRRQIAEEDECPVCFEELPPRGPNGETADRERHVENCIASHVYTSTPPSRTVSAPPDAPEDTASTGASASISGMSPAGGRSGSLPSSSSAPLRPRRMTGGRMLLYRATEKDCVAEDGSEAECVICFEEFEPGDEMGRLECLCRFHKTCIRQWWDTKGSGSCPTHQLHD